MCRLQGLRADAADDRDWFRERGIEGLLFESVVLLSVLQPLLKLFPAFLQPGQHLILFACGLVDLGLRLAHHPGTSHNCDNSKALRDHAGA